MIKYSPEMCLRWGKRAINRKFLLFIIIVEIIFIIQIFVGVLNVETSTREMFGSIIKSQPTFQAMKVNESSSASSEPSRSMRKNQSAWQLTRAPSHRFPGSRTSIAMGLAITSRGNKKIEPLALASSFPFFRELIPSFCKTASTGYDYHFYLAHDKHDILFTNYSFQQLVNETFDTMRHTHCVNISMTLKFVQCGHDGHPARAQNEAMMAAYLDNMEYYYRINDDTIFLSSAWTESLIAILLGYSPPNIGVAGPKVGKLLLLTYEFVHRTHLDIFGFYYPRAFTTWFADFWIGIVYMPYRFTITNKISLNHTSSMGRRYAPDLKSKIFLPRENGKGRKILERYLKAVKAGHFNRTLQDRRVVSMSLTGISINHTFGAIRNAQLLPVLLPGWKIRIYMENPVSGGNIWPAVAVKILQKLQQLGSDVYFVEREVARSLPWTMWGYLVVDDPDVDVAVMRSCQSRLSERETFAVEQWLKTDRAFHCARDLPKHADHALMPHLWGARTKLMTQFLNMSMASFLQGIIENVPLNSCKDAGTNDKMHNSSKDFQISVSPCEAMILDAIWSMVKDIAYCHDSVSCNKYIDSHPLPKLGEGEFNMGSLFDAFDIVINITNQGKSEGTNYTLCPTLSPLAL